MIRRLLFAASFLGLVTLAGGCAVTDVQDQAGPAAASTPRAEPAARIGLPQPYRVFYDELQDEGDWTLIEPYGYVFRPRVNFVAWRPYQDGWWEPSDYYGWIWNTYEPFGWITYHYGSWFYDEYQGWVWQPGPVWGPAWVAWVEAGDYVGWAPLAPQAYDGFDQVPDGVFTYTPITQFTARNLGQEATFVAHLPESGSRFHEIVNVGRVNGVAFNKGPDPFELQQRGGVVGERFDPGTLPRVKLAGAVPRWGEADLQARTARLVDEGARELQLFRTQGVAPPTVHGPLPEPVPAPSVGPAGPPRIKPSPPATPADSTRRHRVPTPRTPRPPRGAPADSGAHGRRSAPFHRLPDGPVTAPDTTRDR